MYQIIAVEHLKRFINKCFVFWYNETVAQNFYLKTVNINSQKLFYSKLKITLMG